MARATGTAGKALKRKLWLMALFFLGVAALTYLVVRLLAPPLAPLASMLALVPVLRLLRSRTVERAIVANARGYLGEARVGRALEGLPEGWRVFHDLDLGGENADHVVAGPRGVFNVEAKNYSGRAVATPKGLYVNGRRDDQVVRQGWRQARRLEEALGVEVRPVLVFAGGRLEGERAGRLPVVEPSRLAAFLLGQEGELGYEAARPALAKLEAMAR